VGQKKQHEKCFFSNFLPNKKGRNKSDAPCFGHRDDGGWLIDYFIVVQSSSQEKKCGPKSGPWCVVRKHSCSMFVKSPEESPNLEKKKY